MANSEVVQNLYKLRIRLPMHLLQFVDTLDASLPCGGLEAESLLGRGSGRCSEISLYDRRQLQEVTAQDELYATKGAIIAPNVTCDGFNFLAK